MKHKICDDMLKLVKDFLQKKIDAILFEENFLEMRREKIRLHAAWENNKQAEAMDRIFSAIDRFCPDEDRDEIELDKDQLYAEVRYWACHMETKN